LPVCRGDRNAFATCLQAQILDGLLISLRTCG
jgi:hypothetical protein